MNLRRNTSCLLQAVVVWCSGIWLVFSLLGLGFGISQIILMARLRTRRSFGDVLKAIGGCSIFPLVCYARSLNALNRLAWNPTTPLGSYLQQVHDILQGAPSHGKREESKPEQRDVQKMCVRLIYRKILNAEPEDRTLHVLSLYGRPADAMIDLLDYCRARNAMISRRTVLANVDGFVSELLAYRQQSAERLREKGDVTRPNGELPPTGYFDGNGKVAVRRMGATQCLLDAYWQIEHAHRLTDPNRGGIRLASGAELAEAARIAAGNESLPALHRHEMKIQGARELIAQCRPTRTADRAEQLKASLARLVAIGKN